MDPYQYYAQQHSTHDSSTRNKAYSVDHSNPHSQPQGYVRAKSTQISHDSHSPYATPHQHYHSPYAATPNNYSAAQMQQMQQQQQAKTHKIKKSRKHRQQNVEATPDPMPPFQDTHSVPITNQQYIERNSHQQQQKKSRRRHQPPQHMYNNNDSDHNNNNNHHHHDNGHGANGYVDADSPKVSKSRRRRTRSKSPYDDDNDGDMEEVRRTKHSVPNVANMHMQMPQQQNQAVRHSSTPNAMAVQSNGNHKRERKQRRRKKKDSVATPDSAHGHDVDYDSTDSAPNQQRRVQSVNAAALEHVHEDRSESVSRTRKKKRRSKKPPRDDNAINTADSSASASDHQQTPDTDRKRRHTTQVQATPALQVTASDAHSQRSRKKSVGRKKSAAKLDSSSGRPKEDDQWAKLNKGVLAKDYEIRDKLGKGSFSVVRRVVRRLDGAMFAAKIISTKTFQTNDLNEHLHEALILSELRHPNIVRLVEYKKTTRHLYLVMEMLNGGELFERLQGLKKFNEHKAAKITRQIADALAYMHGKGVVHRDLKPENIIFSTKREDALVKITDFGLSRNVKLSGGSLKTACGTPGYVAPEILRSQPYSEAVDLWALGVIIYILLCGFAPFSGQHQEQMFQKIKAGKYSYSDPVWSRITAVAKDCIDSLLVITATDRMSAKELLQHPWIKMADREPDGTFEDIEFQQNLSTYLHKKRFRRGVRLIITLNRMIRGAGLEALARQQRREFRIRLAKHKEMEKAKQRFIWQKQKEAARLPPDQRNDDDYFMNYTVIDPDETPAIDYSKI